MEYRIRSPTGGMGRSRLAGLLRKMKYQEREDKNEKKDDETVSIFCIGGGSMFCPGGAHACGSKGRRGDRNLDRAF